MSWINLGEVAYIVQRAADRQTALDTIRDLRPRLTLEIPTPDRVLAAADIKARYRVAYADAFAVATALGNDAVLLTGDPEILSAGAEWPVEDLR
jgi:predicted nucleic acid-binding protein